MEKKYYNPDHTWTNQRYCPICGKEFYITAWDSWVYRIDHKYYCSWTCYRKAQKTKKVKKNES